jgi:hypothetical protein
MAVTINKYNKFLLTQNNGGSDTTGSSTAGAARVIDFDTDTIKLALCTATYAPSATGHAAFNSVTNEVSGTNYTAGGITLTSPTVVDATGTITFDAADVVFAQSASGFTVLSTSRLVLLLHQHWYATLTLVLTRVTSTVTSRSRSTHPVS